eukprot:7406744-Pyramimonas_sp.AAC.1
MVMDRICIGGQFSALRLPDARQSVQRRCDSARLEPERFRMNLFWGIMGISEGLGGPTEQGWLQPGG